MEETKGRPDRPPYVSGDSLQLSQQMNLRKKDDTTVLATSLCIGVVLGTYQSDQVTTVNFVIVISHS
jgi:hypothetical protein